ncbi:MAG: hypothetical protein NUV90_03785 [Candidatus Parcubacteria bacterium]|nr:hypothetical protein [Candidatus Parcubacteria bacterium]
MIWPIGFAIAFVILTYLEFYRYAHSFLEYFMGSLILGMMTVLVFGIGLGLAFLIGLFLPKKWSDPTKTKMVSLRSGDGVSGQFFLGTGHINSVQYYFFYEEAGNGGYRPGKISADDDVVVFETDRQDGELKTYQLGFSNSLLNVIAVDIGNTRHEFFIPNGSLKKGFVL